MSARIFLHVGPPKTGTTYLQHLLYTHADELAEQGLRVVGTQMEQHLAANELMQRRAKRAKRVPAGAFDSLRAQVLADDSDVVLSCERWSLLDPEHCRTFRDSFSGRELHVVVTLRDLASVLPSQWQERVKNGATFSWPEFCDKVESQPGFLASVTRTLRPFDAWRDVLPVERVHVVTVPGSSAPRTLLLDRFAEVVGVDASVLSQRTSRARNESVDLVGAELLRRLHLGVEPQVNAHVQHSEIKFFLTRELLAKRASGPRPQLTRGAWEVATAESERLAQRLAAEGYPVTGSLEELTASAEPGTGPTAEVDDTEVLELALAAIATLARRSYRRAQRIGELEREREALVRQTPRALLDRVRRRLGRSR